MSPSAKSPEDYIVRVRAGPDYSQEKLRLVHPNDESHPLLIQGPHFTGFLGVRMLSFNGMVDDGKEPIKTPKTTYFKGRNRRYSVILQGRFAQEINGNDILFGVDSDTPARLPTGVGVAIKIAKWLDPAVNADVSAPKPYLYSPFLCAMNSLGVFDPESDEVNDVFEKQTGKSILADGAPIPSSSSSTSSPSPCDYETPSNINIGKWSFHSRMVPENVDRLVNEEAVLEAAAVNGTTSPSNSTSWLAKNFSALKTTASSVAATSSSPSTTTTTSSANKIELGSYEKRKRYFADEKKRLDVTISPRHVYCMDFYDAYFDISNISLKLPGFSISIFKYWDQQPLRFVCKNRNDPSIVYFTVWFEWVDRSTLSDQNLLTVHDSSSKEASLRSFHQRNSVEVSSFHSVPEHVLRDSASEISGTGGSSGSGGRGEAPSVEEEGAEDGASFDEDKFENAENGED